MDLVGSGEREMEEDGEGVRERLGEVEEEAESLREGVFMGD